MVISFLNVFKSKPFSFSFFFLFSLHCTENVVLELDDVAIVCADASPN